NAVNPLFHIGMGGLATYQAIENDDYRAAGAAGVKTAIMTIATVATAAEGLQALGGRTGAAIDVRLPSSRYPEAAAHIRDAQAAGKPSQLTIGQPGSAAARRAEALAGKERVPGKDLDEYPPAMFEEGGAGASVRPISPADNRGAGACIGNQCRGLAPGTKVRIVVE
ncbi:MAG: hypothetical protein IT372_11630, partial [Polyangiaceae bacterium]|nr:hypothetical protein [Polyangiaceae bacterium]